MGESNKYLAKANDIHGGKYKYISIVKPEVIKLTSKIDIICEIHGIFNQSLKNHIYLKTGCPKCSNKNMDTNSFVQKAVIIHKDLYNYDSTVYVTAKQKVNIFCNKCLLFFDQTPDSHLNKKSGCFNCKGKNNIKFEDFLKRVNNIHFKKYAYDESSYISFKKKMKITCDVHGVFEQSPSNHLYLEQGCPRCNSSKGESMIRNILINNNIKYIEQYRFDNCINPITNRVLVFDFYLPDINLCIEYDGIQHMKSIEYFGGKRQFLKQQVNDLIKDQYCDMNNIRLIRYNHLNKIKE